MVFNSLTFLVFFAVVLLLHNLPIAWRHRKLNLLVASYLFYAAWNPPFVLLLWISTAVDWSASRFIHRSDSRRVRRFFLLLSLSTNLGLLGFFKYGNFLLDAFVGLMGAWGMEIRPLEMDLILPIGISYYPFQTLSYTIDVYRKKNGPWESLQDFALYVTFFPQLVCGPIVRSSDFLPQCREPRRASGRQLGWGFTLLALGLFEKIILADTWLAPVADKVYAQADLAGLAAAWVGTLAFSGQILFDFAGYSTCAIGVGLCLGFALPDNFRYPYAALGFTDFWRRWHITLSSWLRDYLYIPLGGARRGPIRTLVNLTATMLLGGLWHGASWRFVAWGGLHGIYLGAEWLLRRLFGRAGWVRSRPAVVVWVLLTYFLVVLAWVFFRAPDFECAWTILTAMLVAPGGDLFINLGDQALVFLVTTCLIGYHWVMRSSSLEELWSRFPWPVRALVLTVILICLALAPGDDRAFIYFQF